MKHLSKEEVINISLEHLKSYLKDVNTIKDIKLELKHIYKMGYYQGALEELKKK